MYIYFPAGNPEIPLDFPAGGSQTLPYRSSVVFGCYSTPLKYRPLVQAPGSKASGLT